MKMNSFSQAAENNKQPILDVLRRYLKGDEQVLEIGSGTGQHAIFFAAQLPHIRWQTSDLKINHSTIQTQIQSQQQTNVLAPLELDINCKSHWPQTHYDVVFSANTAHIMSWQEVQLMLECSSQVLNDFGRFILYGPFNLDGQFTSASNQQFDAYLKSQANHMGLRDIHHIEKEANKHGLELLDIIDMPANNKVLTFKN